MLSDADRGRIAAGRAFFETFGHPPLPPGTTVTPTTLGGVPALEVRPATARPDGALMYVHGGGYVIGSAASRAPLAAALAARTRLRAYVIDYRLAPEHPLPAAGEDALAAYADLAARLEPASLAVVGDSAGAGIAVGTLLVARDGGVALPGAAVAFSGWFDLTLSGDSLTSKESVDPVFSAADMAWYAGIALNGHDAAHPRVSPLHGDLSGFPPLLLQVGSHEVLLDDTTGLAARAAAADVSVTLETYPGQPHVFQQSAVDVPPSGTAVRALDSAARFLAEHLPVRSR
jgi:monoterpene epsilon-lactone hydrolase